MNYIITKHPEFFSFGEYNFCELSDMILPDILAYDSETTGLEARKQDIFCVQLGNGLGNNYIIHMYDDNYIFEDIIPYIQNKTLIGHNLLFDLGFMYKHNFYPKNVKDTMLASRILYNGDFSNLRADFGAVMQRELNQYYDKVDQKNISTVRLSQPSTILYSFNDVDRLLELHSVMEKKIIDNGQQATYDLHCRYIRALAYIEQCGLPISSELWKKKMENDVYNTEIAKIAIQDYIYDNISKFRDGQLDMFSSDKKINISITSPIQMLKVFKELKIETKDRNGNDSINEKVISKSKHEFVQLWLAFQEAQHRITTFGDGIYKQIENERIYTSFNPMVDTARLSTRKGGINFLNFPSDDATRNCFKANRGRQMVVCDFSAQEGVIMADLSEDKAMTASITEGIDLHCLFARVLFPELAELSDEEIIKNYKDLRQAAKVPRFLFSYGGNGYTLHVQEGIPMERAMKIDKEFKELHSGLYKWGNHIYEISVEKGYIDSSDGWRIKLPKFEEFKELRKEIEQINSEHWAKYRDGKAEYKKLQDNKNYIIQKQGAFEYYKSKKYNVSQFFKLKSEYQRLSLNFPVQAMGAHQLKLSTCLLFEWIEKENLIDKVLIVNSIHDELNIECETIYSELVKEKLEACMKQGGNHYLTNLTIEAKAGIGKSWYSAKK